MGFKNLELDQKNSRNLRELREAVRIPSYKPVPEADPEPEQVYLNLDHDELIPDQKTPDSLPASRRELLDSLLSRREIGALDAFQQFCWSHQQEGPDEEFARLGHVIPLERLAGWISESCSSSMNKRQIESLIRDLSNRVDDLEEALSEQKRRLASLHVQQITAYQMWSFEAGTEQADQIESRSEAIDRLGLGQLEGSTAEVVIWHHGSEEQHQPTAWDAEKNPYWRPGGRTKPLSSGDTEDGFPECVHPPVGPDSFRSPIRELSD